MIRPGTIGALDASEDRSPDTQMSTTSFLLVEISWARPLYNE